MSLFKRKPKIPGRVKRIAHKGLSGRYPENTKEAFATAAEAGFDAVETDVWEVPGFYDDGRTGFVLMHDSDLKRMCGAGVKVKDLTEETIHDHPITAGNGNDSRQTYHIATLQEYIHIMKDTGMDLHIELKDDNISLQGAQMIIDMLRKAAVLQRTCFISFSRKSLETVMGVCSDRGSEDDSVSGAEIASRMPHFGLLVGLRNKGRIGDCINWCMEKGISYMGIRYSLYTDKVADRLKSCGITAGVWAADDDKKVSKAVKRGAGCVTVDDII